MKRKKYNKSVISKIRKLSKFLMFRIMVLNAKKLKKKIIEKWHLITQMMEVL